MNFVYSVYREAKCTALGRNGRHRLVTLLLAFTTACGSKNSNFSSKVQSVTSDKISVSELITLGNAANSDPVITEMVNKWRNFSWQDIKSLYVEQGLNDKKISILVGGIPFSNIDVTPETIDASIKAVEPMGSPQEIADAFDAKGLELSQDKIEKNSREFANGLKKSPADYDAMSDDDLENLQKAALGTYGTVGLACAKDLAVKPAAGLSLATNSQLLPLLAVVGLRLATAIVSVVNVQHRRGSVTYLPSGRVQYIRPTIVRPVIVNPPIYRTAPNLPANPPDYRPVNGGNEPDFSGLNG